MGKWTRPGTDPTWGKNHPDWVDEYGVFIPSPPPPNAPMKWDNNADMLWDNAAAMEWEGS